MSFKLVSSSNLYRFSATGFLYVHDSGARVLHIKNDDPHKVFMPSFTTHPEDNRGLPHIAEHCLIDASEQFPEGGLFDRMRSVASYTYLNALTYRDKTVYPIATFSDEDFYDMALAYMDGLYRPIFKKEVFYREVKPDGVIVSELRDFYSDPTEVLLKRAYSRLYYGTCYAYSAYGIPELVPTVAYAELDRFYRRFYTAEDAVIYVYGDADINRIFDIIEPYLIKRCNAEDTPTPGITVDAFCMRKTNSAGLFFKTNPHEDVNSSAILQILKIYFEKLGYEIHLDNEIRQHMFGFITNESDIDGVIDTMQRQLSHSQLSLPLLEYALNRYAFMIADEVTGYKPKALVYGLSAVTDMLYGLDPFERAEPSTLLKTWRADISLFYKILTLSVERYLGSDMGVRICIRP